MPIAARGAGIGVHHGEHPTGQTDLASSANLLSGEKNGMERNVY